MIASDEVCANISVPLNSETVLAVVVTVDDTCEPTARMCYMADGTVPADGTIPAC